MSPGRPTASATADGAASWGGAAAAPPDGRGRAMTTSDDGGRWRGDGGANAGEDGRGRRERERERGWRSSRSTDRLFTGGCPRDGQGLSPTAARRVDVLLLWMCWCGCVDRPTSRWINPSGLALVSVVVHESLRNPPLARGGGTDDLESLATHERGVASGSNHRMK
jgi:hypothetical protein